ncbi:predicted protein [Plenodomus lingam JN3]|uniref:Predicted protein n=1 Tax=Leptosphaeria maculans (strain JN3 / isolate v23.1.3 / race Av1-4-5-6-7-8) TaxID=985895 RepID=E5R478_LEPMJ|nr:predicted protein [Plenodomus lingam JN3]CBX91846.1 predicted protein [Plenodomus lingam JN3]
MKPLGYNNQRSCHPYAFRSKQLVQVHTAGSAGPCAKLEHDRDTWSYRIS